MDDTPRGGRRGGARRPSGGGRGREPGNLHTDGLTEPAVVSSMAKDRCCHGFYPEWYQPRQTMMQDVLDLPKNQVGMHCLPASSTADSAANGMPVCVGGFHFIACSAAFTALALGHLR